MNNLTARRRLSPHEVTRFLLYRARGELFLKNEEAEMSKNSYRIHRFDLKMTSEQSKLELFLNNLEGVIVAIIPNVGIGFLWIHRVDFLLIVEKLS